MKIFTILATVALLAVPSLANAQHVRRAPAPSPIAPASPCGDMRVSDSAKVSAATPGYREVDIELNVVRDLTRVPAGTMPSLPWKPIIDLGFYTLAPGIMPMADKAIVWVSRCERETLTQGRRFRAGVTWIRVKGLVEADDVQDDRKGFTARARIVLPNAIVTAHPVVYTVLNEGDLYEAMWDMRPARPILTLTKKEPTTGS